MFYHVNGKYMDKKQYSNDIIMSYTNKTDQQ